MSSDLFDVIRLEGSGLGEAHAVRHTLEETELKMFLNLI